MALLTTATLYQELTQYQQNTTVRRVPAAPRLPEPVKHVYGPNKVLAGWAGPQNQISACGVGNLYSFKKLQLSDYDKEQARRLEVAYTKETLAKGSGGCGFLSAAFIDTEECKIMYKQLKEWYPVLYQSPIRFNVNSGNNFFFCIFDTGEKIVPDCYSNEDDDEFEYFPDDEAAGFKNGMDW